jgi:hypothetical protein
MTFFVDVRVGFLAVAYWEAHSMKRILVIIALLVVGYFALKPSNSIACLDKDGKAVRSKVACHEANLLTPEQYAADPTQRPRAEAPPSRPGPQQPSNPQVAPISVDPSVIAPLDSPADRIAVLTALATRLQCRVPDISDRLAGQVTQMLSIGSEPLGIAPGEAQPGSSIASADCGPLSVRNSIRSAVVNFYQGPSDEVPAVLLEPIR